MHFGLPTPPPRMQPIHVPPTIQPQHTPPQITPHYPFMRPSACRSQKPSPSGSFFSFWPLTSPIHTWSIRIIQPPLLQFTPPYPTPHYPNLNPPLSQCAAAFHHH